ncbi:protein jag [Lederbergia sp. NSJ-179]|uniref:RNA-binding cell elongation regulator Jag/EloR n=1 Tax=Lederbergia sp. NSJ-179 TaxID=2931402 RepID=UPI001FD09BA5|nr:RNA-binding cell elongation regulator Jag/EloR [Lederbergia sp. NSJ-179]MCJ7843503.1 protein jag [Lederbergia sp. NSJ-179]
MREITATGQTVEEAVESALAQLEITRDRTEITIVEEGKKGLLGLFGARPAIVKVKVKPTSIEATVEYVQNILANMGIAAEIKVEKRDERHVIFHITGEKMGLLIGKRGQTINSLQYLAQLAANRHADPYITVILNPENYRDRREQTLIQLAKRLASKAQQLNKPITLEPMPNFERKIIHTALAENKKVQTVSDGREPNRYVVIKPLP